MIHQGCSSSQSRERDLETGACKRCMTESSSIMVLLASLPVGNMAYRQVSSMDQRDTRRRFVIINRENRNILYLSSDSKFQYHSIYTY